MRIGAGVAEFVFHEVGEEARAEGEVGVDGDVVRGDHGELLVAVGEGGRVEFGDAMDEVAEVDGYAAEAEGAAVGFGEVEGGGNDLG